MKTVFKSEALPLGLAMFSMFFGAGNIIFSLALGQYAGNKNTIAVVGLIITAAIIPIAGVIAMILFNGSHRDFFGRLGKTPGFILSLVIISLLGPLGSTPRCIALSYTTLKSAYLDISPILFSALACALIYFLAAWKKHILTILGLILTPVLLCSLIAIIGMGLFTNHQASFSDHTQLSLFFHGLKEGYNTMDLLAAFFFSSTILNLLRLRLEKKESTKNPLPIALKASFIGAFLLAVIYVCFSTIASFHGIDLGLQSKDQLLAAIALKIAGPYAGLLVCTIVAFACLTTAIALISAFSDFIQKQVFKERISYPMVLFGSLVITFLVSTFEFNGISAFLGPILVICYPGLILMTFLNIAHQLVGFKSLKLPVFLTFAVSAAVYFLV